MFGAEGDRLAAMRQQQQQQYAEELRRQIEEKQNKAIRQKKTPPAYSTTQNDSMQDTLNNNNYNNNTTTTNNGNNNNITNSPNGNFSVRPPNMARQNQAPPRSNYFNSPNRNVENRFNDTQYNQNNYSNDNDANANYSNNYNTTSTNYSNNRGNREDYYSIPTTSTIAPLTLNVQPPSSIMTTTYMLGPTSTMTRGSLNADRSTFPSRIDSLESRIFNLREELSSRTEKVNEFNDSIFPSISRDITDLRNRIECESSHDIPQQIQPIRNSIKDERSTIENNNQNQRDIFSSISSTFSELNGKISTFSPLFNDFQETSKTSFVSLRGDINRHRNQLESSNAKIGKIETQDIGIINNLSALNEDLNETDKQKTASFISLENGTNDMMESISSQIFHDIYQTSQQRSTVSTQLQTQVSELNERSKSAITRLIENIKQLNFKDSLEDISKQISNAINSSTTETSLKFNELTRKFDSFLADCEDHFASIDNETVSTIETLKSNHTKSIDVIENCIEEETRIRSKNVNEIMAKYQQFGDVIEQEEKLQKENIKNTFSDFSIQTKTAFNEQISPMYNDVHCAVYLISHIEETERKLTKLELMVNDANQNLSQNVKSFENEFQKLTKEMANEKKRISKYFDDIESKINNIEVSTNKNKSVKRTEIQSIQKEIEISFDQKLAIVEEEISEIMKQISNIQMSSDNIEMNNLRNRRLNKNIAKTDNRTEGAILVESLVKETSNKAKTLASPSTKKEKKKKIYGEQDNSLFLTNNKTLEIQTDNEEGETDTENDISSPTTKNETTPNENHDSNNSNENDNLNNSNENDSLNNSLIEEEEEVKDDDENENENYSKIGSNVMLETCQRFHFDPNEVMKQQQQNNNNKKVIKKKATTVKFNLKNDEENNDNKEESELKPLKSKKSHSMPKIDIENENKIDHPKFKVDTSFSSNSLKQGITTVNNKSNKNGINDSTSVSNSSSSAQQIDDTPLSAKDANFPFARTNEIEQMLKPESLATLPQPPPHSLSQIIESSSKNIFSDDENDNNPNNDDDNNEETKTEEDTKAKTIDLSSKLTELEKTPPHLATEGINMDDFKFNPVDFKIDLNIQNQNQDHNQNENVNKNHLDQIIDRVDKIVKGINDKNYDNYENCENYEQDKVEEEENNDKKNILNELIDDEDEDNNIK